MGMNQSTRTAFCLTAVFLGEELTDELKLVGGTRRERDDAKHGSEDVRQAPET